MVKKLKSICSCSKHCKSLKEMRSRHGTPAEFAEKVRAAIGEIALDEAERAIRKYEAEWVKASVNSL